MVTVSPQKSDASPSWAYALRLPHDPLAPRVARVTLKAVLGGHGMASVADAAELLASELVTNAYRHSGGPSTLRLRALGRGRLRISVQDGDPRIPPPFDRRYGVLGPVPAEVDGGRGLFLVCHYADAWGGHPLGDELFGRSGKVLWCEVGPPWGAAPEGVSG
ncbi:ATP-binding protein [Streptomyces sp. NPDC127038]|uniref:ATP-binding protein n=1 Tax=Streptomyces sp. NPDC127038 TaxID=3347114 RepID=UPI003660BDBF